MIYEINYDLRTPGKDYKGVYEAIKQCGDWWHHLESTWLVSTSRDAGAIFSQLKPHLDSNDYVLAVGITRDYQGWLPEEAWDWINQRINKA